MKTKSNEAYKTITEVGQALEATTSAIRFWEKEFKQINPRMINKRRYYSKKDIGIIETIKDLLYNKGYTLNGAKKHLKSLTISANSAEIPSSELECKIRKVIERLLTAKEELRKTLL